MFLVKFRILFLLLGVFLLAAFNSHEASAQKIQPVKKQTVKTTSKTSTDSFRRQIEASLLRGEDQHDGSIKLIEIGTIESVPALLKVLEDHPPFNGNPGKNVDDLNKNSATNSEPKKSYICTYAHAVAALRKITGQNYTEYEDWRNWWEATGKIKQKNK
jgi:hypothetical protein